MTFDHSYNLKKENYIFYFPSYVQLKKKKNYISYFPS